MVRSGSLLESVSECCESLKVAPPLFNFLHVHLDQQWAMRGFFADMLFLGGPESDEQL